ncbi:14397_t:CDS:2 [Ambispora leptoticha]|uniref:14397_t:CDS:1 n=1 Tax=Ambispora leptoticha TaxID=144679 RepID=A0A9N9DCN9_9GLOM|nr:14397_t:CDS:2 [Ambispora leptoticha]
MEYPKIRTGGSLIVAWRAKEKNVLIVGGGNVAAARIVSVLEADAKVIVVCPENGLNSEVKYRIESNQVDKWINREFCENDLEGIDMVLTAIDDPIESRKIYELCRTKKIPVNVADVPSLCDFYFMSQHRDGPLQIAVSTNGQGPKLANIIRRQIADTLPKGAGAAITKVGKLREKLRQIDPEHSSSSKRMGWMIPQYNSLLENISNSITINNGGHESNKHTVSENFKGDNINVKQETSNGSNGIAEDNIENNNKKRESTGPIEIIQQANNKDEIIEDSNNIEVHNTKKDTNNLKKKGRIILVGAGPGDPSLLTHKATSVLAKADLILSDRLIPPAILSYANCDVRLAALKSGAAKVKDSQDQLLSWGLEALKEGKTVVRLKIGDPFIFGRGGEEVAFFRKMGWEAEVIPGVSSAFSAPLSANIPLTHRGVADQIFITTGQGTQGRMPEIPNYHHTRTTVFLMAVGKANELSGVLLEKEYPMDLPAAFVENANRPNERVLRATVATLGKVVEINKIVSPAILIIGKVVDVLHDNDNVCE